MVFSDIATAQAALTDPTTSPQDLMSIAQAFPSLWAEIAKHPNAYPDLLTWLDQVGGDDVHQAIAERNVVARSAPIPALPIPSPPTVAATNATSVPATGHPKLRKLRQRWPIIAIVTLLVVAIAVAAVLVANKKSQDAVQPVVAQDNLPLVVASMNLELSNTDTLDCVSGSIIQSFNLYEGEGFWGAIFLTEFQANDSLKTQMAACYDSGPGWMRDSDQSTKNSGIVMEQYRGSLSSMPGNWYSYSAAYGNVVVFSAWYDQNNTTTFMSWSQWQNWAKKTFRPAVDNAANQIVSGKSPSVTDPTYNNQPAPTSTWPSVASVTLDKKSITPNGSEQVPIGTSCNSEAYTNLIEEIATTIGISAIPNPTYGAPSVQFGDILGDWRVWIRCASNTNGLLDWLVFSSDQPQMPSENYYPWIMSFQTADGYRIGDDGSDIVAHGEKGLAKDFYTLPSGITYRVDSVTGKVIRFDCSG